MTPYINININQLSRDIKYTFGVDSIYTIRDTALDILERINEAEISHVEFLYTFDDGQDTAVQLFFIREYDDFIDLVECTINVFFKYELEENELKNLLNIIARNSVLTINERNHGDIVRETEQ